MYIHVISEPDQEERWNKYGGKDSNKSIPTVNLKMNRH